MATKHIPQRTCIICRATRAKRELTRVVYTPDKHVEVDPTRKKAGRGAYLCAVRDCWTQALSQPSRLGQALKLETAISADDLAQLREFATTLPMRETSAAETNRTV